MSRFDIRDDARRDMGQHEQDGNPLACGCDPDVNCWCSTHGAERRIEQLERAVEIAVNSCRDVTRLGRFALNVDPVRWVAQLKAHLESVLPPSEGPDDCDAGYACEDDIDLTMKQPLEPKR